MQQGRKYFRLKALQVPRLGPGFHCDGDGLYLQVSDAGARSWILRYTLNGKPRSMGLGSCRTCTLAEAREQAAEQRKLLAAGTDPLTARERSRAVQRATDANVVTFDTAAAAFIASNEAGWRNAKHGEQWKNTLATYASPVIGSLSVADITTAHVIRILSPIWTTKTETATRLRGRIEKILDWAKVHGYRSGDNPAAWRGHLSEALPAPSKVANAGHHAALPWQQVSAFMAQLQTMPGTASLAAQAIILAACRTSEVLNAIWSEFDLDAGLWTIPASRMKGNRAHTVPLGGQLLQILRDQVDEHDSSPDAYVFPGIKPGRPLSNMSCLALLKRMNRGDLTMHGFRSTFRDWSAEATAHPRDVCEMALAHAIADKSEAAYRRGDLLEKRRLLMADWAAFCAKPSLKAVDITQVVGKLKK